MHLFLKVFAGAVEDVTVLSGLSPRLKLKTSSFYCTYVIECTDVLW